MLKTLTVLLVASNLLLVSPVLAHTDGTMANASLGVDVSFPADIAWDTGISACRSIPTRPI